MANTKDDDDGDELVSCTSAKYLTWSLPRKRTTLRGTHAESHFTDKKTCSERESNRLKATQLGNGRGGIQVQFHWMPGPVLCENVNSSLYTPAVLSRDWSELRASSLSFLFPTSSWGCPSLAGLAKFGSCLNSLLFSFCLLIRLPSSFLLLQISTSLCPLMH